MKTIKHILVLAILLSGCEDMKMDRKVIKRITFVDSSVINR